MRQVLLMQYYVYIQPQFNLLCDCFPLGNVYFADYSNHRIRKVTVSTGIITTFAGIGTNTYSGDGAAATSAGLYYPTGVALDASGTYLSTSPTRPLINSHFPF